MSRRHLSRLALVVVAFLAGPLAAGAQQWAVAVTADGTVAPCAAGDPSCLAAGKVNLLTAPTATVTVSCAGGVDCSQVGLQLEQGGAVTVLGPPAGAGTSTLVYTVPAAAVGSQSNLAVLVAGAKVDSFALGAVGGAPPAPAGGASGGGAGGGGGDDLTLAELLSLPCQAIVLEVTPSYDAAANRGEVVVDPLGNLLAPLPEDFELDENDELGVWVVGATTLLPVLKVERTSAFRDATAVRILGGDQTAPLLERQSAPGCGRRRFSLRDFAPGQGQVTISRLGSSGSLTAIGTFSLQVNPLYHGMLTLGAARTDLVDPGFRLVSNGTETVIGLGDAGSDDLLYTLFYTPFVWGPRDVQKPLRWYQRLSPSLGVVVDDLADNALLGLSASLPGGFVLTGGTHFRRVTVLPADTGLTVGSPFAGTAEELPTATEWDDDVFYALSVDLRVMVQFLKAAAGG